MYKDELHLGSEYKELSQSPHRICPYKMEKRHSNVLVWLISGGGQEWCPAKPEKGRQVVASCTCLNICAIMAGMFWWHLWWASCILDSMRLSASSASARSRCTDTCVRRCRWPCLRLGQSRWCILRFCQQRGALRRRDRERWEGWGGNWAQSLEEKQEKVCECLKMERTWLHTQTTPLATVKVQITPTVGVCFF